MSEITLEPSVLQWARKRAGLDQSALALKVLGKDDPDRVREWETTGELTFRRAEIIAEKTYTPFGYLFLKEPPEEKLPINDFRTLENASIQRASPALLDTIYQCQQRQEWYRDYMKSLGAEPLRFIGALNTEYPIRAAEDIRARFKIGTFISSRSKTWRENLTLHFEAMEDAGILVMRSGVVGNNGKRKLSTDEFRGFALSDPYAPLIFINSRDPLAAQLFTLIHEVAHLCAGQSGVSNPIRTYSEKDMVEQYCNQVAAEVLVPIREFEKEWRQKPDLAAEMKRLSGAYKVSTLVIARRARDSGFITPPQFRAFYESEARRYWKSQERADSSESSGNFYNTLSARAGNRFSRALIASTLEGRTTYREAFRMLGINNSAAFRNFARAKYGYDLG